MATHRDPEVFLAPMSGITDAPFRAAVGRFGVGTLVSEMVASDAMIAQMRDVRKLRHVFEEGTSPILQLAGYDPVRIARAVEIACDRGAIAIDLNFGCPSRKVTGKASGSALMRDEALSAEIFAAVGAVCTVPWSVKMRLGWDEDRLNGATLAAIAEAQGACRITVHARTRCQFYKGRARPDLARPIAEALGIPLIINGDIATASQAVRAMQRADAQGYMVGRALVGRPWGLAEMECERKGEPWHLTRADQGVALAALCEDMMSFHGHSLGLKSFRKHLAAWLEGQAEARQWLTCTQGDSLLTFLRDGAHEPDQDARLAA